VIPLRPASEGPWPTVDHLLLPGARPEIEGLVCEVRDYLEAERVARAALPGSRTRRRTAAARVDGAVTTLFEALRILGSDRQARAVDLELEPDTARAFRIDAARFVAQWQGYLVRLKGRCEWLARHREHPSSRHNYVREVVFDRLTRIVEPYRRDSNAPLITQDRKHNEPYGVLVEVAVALRDCLPCLPRSESAVHRAYFRAKARRRQRK
jgi:hypothetical protein